MKRRFSYSGNLMFLVVLVLIGLVVAGMFLRKAPLAPGIVVEQLGYDLPEATVTYTGPEDVAIELDTESVLGVRDIKKLRKDVARLKLWAWGERDE